MFPSLEPRTLSNHDNMAWGKRPNLCALHFYTSADTHDHTIVKHWLAREFSHSVNDPWLVTMTNHHTQNFHNRSCWDAEVTKERRVKVLALPFWSLIHIDPLNCGNHQTLEQRLPFEHAVQSHRNKCLFFWVSVLKFMYIYNSNLGVPLRQVTTSWGLTSPPLASYNSMMIEWVSWRGVGRWERN